MAFVGHDVESATASVKTATDLTIPANATGVELQADTSDIRYTMDDATDPTQITGMVLVNGLDPEPFLIQDLRKIRFTRGSGSNGNLNCHFWAGRNI